MIVAGGGVHYSDATAALEDFAAQTGIPVGETQAGKGRLLQSSAESGSDWCDRHPLRQLLAREADLVIGIGTRLSDFTTASKTAFQNPDVRFINMNIAPFDARKHSACRCGDARASLEALGQPWLAITSRLNTRRTADRNRLGCRGRTLVNLQHGPSLTQGEVIGVVNTLSQPRDVVVCAAGSLPGDLHKLWRTRDPKGYHLEYGYSCMGYEIAGGLGVKLADPAREVYVMVGDGSYLMMAQEIVTAVSRRRQADHRTP